MENLIFINKLVAWSTAAFMLYLFIPFRYLKPRFLKKLHSVIGILLLPLTLIHCGLTERVTGEHSTMGMFLFVLLLTQVITSLLRKSMRQLWLPVHRLLSTGMLLTVIVHIVTALIS